jgi:hypothetical protein
MAISQTHTSRLSLRDLLLCDLRSLSLTVPLPQSTGSKKMKRLKNKQYLQNIANTKIYSTVFTVPRK